MPPKKRSSTSRASRGSCRVAGALDLTDCTVRRDWILAKAFLCRELAAQPGTSAK
jgi:hypothetical protein